MSAHGKSVTIKEVPAPTWPEGCKAEVAAIIGRYPEGREKSAILPLLHLSMREREGHYVAISDMEAIADIVGVSAAYVDSVCSFYAMFHRHPVGKYMITLCGSMCCHLLGGGRELEAHIKQSLGIGNGETTADGLITLEVTPECLAACDLAPILHVNTEYAVKMTPAKFNGLVAALRSGAGPDAFLERLPLMGGASQEEWSGYQAPMPEVVPDQAAPEAAPETAVVESAAAGETAPEQQ